MSRSRVLLVGGDLHDGVNHAQTKVCICLIFRWLLGIGFIGLCGLTVGVFGFAYVQSASQPLLERCWGRQEVAVVCRTVSTIVALLGIHHYGPAILTCVFGN